MSLLKNKIVLFIVSRYFSYFLQFLNSLVVAYVMGPFFLCVWGFVLLILNYMNFGNFGIELALNVKLSTGDFSNKAEHEKLASNAVLLTLFTSFFYLIIAAVLTMLNVPLFKKFEFEAYLLPVLLIACLNFFNVLFLNICRAYSVYGPISFFQTIVQLLQLPVFFFFKESTLIWALLGAMLVANAVSIVYYLKRLPLHLVFKIDWSTKKQLFLKGMSLLTYTLSFYILMLSTRSVVGYFYEVEKMGLFTFSSNLASALIVGLSSLEFVLFPKMLNKYSSEDISDATVSKLNEVRYLYMGTAFLVVLLGVLGYPLLLLFFADYQSTLTSFALLVIAQVLISSGFGYGALIVSRAKERYLILHGCIAFVLNLVLSYLLKKAFHAEYDVMPLSLLVAFFYYEYMVVKKGRYLLKQSSSVWLVIKDVVPLGFLVPMLSLLAAALTPYYMVFAILALVLFLGLNKQLFSLLLVYVKTFKNKPGVIDIDNG